MVLRLVGAGLMVAGAVLISLWGWLGSRLPVFHMAKIK
jgi:hypothetical protein